MARIKAQQEGSLRDLGMATLGVDKITKSRLKRLAGSTPLCVAVRELVEMGERAQGIEGSTLPLPGQEVAVSPNTFSGIRSDTKSILGKMDAFFSRLVVQPPSVSDLEKAILECERYGLPITPLLEDFASRLSLSGKVKKVVASQEELAFEA